MKKNILIGIMILLVLLSMTACDSGHTSMPDPDKIVPTRDSLVKNLEDSGYTITTLSSVEGSDLTLDRILAEKGNKFIDIVYGLSSEDAPKIFDLYCEMYPDDYYILAQNGNYVYCISDKRTFSKAGFTSMGNVGVQYING